MTDVSPRKVEFSSKLFRDAAAVSVIYFTLAFGAFGAWVHYYYAGNYSGPLLISTMFGIPDAARDSGAAPVYEYPVAGWDGQFYYNQSNDPLMLFDYAATSGVHTKHLYFDNLSYRFQRNGLSMFAAAVARCCGFKNTPAFIYFGTQFAIVSFGVGVLFVFHRQLGGNGWLAFAWGFYGGIIRPLVHGLPDPTADTLLLFSIVFVLRKNLILYSLCCSLLCLCRESYAAPAAAVWLASILWTDYWWKEKTSRILAMLLTALPGVMVIAWASYVAIRSETGFLGGSREVPWGALVDWPCKAYFECLAADIRIGKWNDILQSTSCFAVLMSVMYVLFRAVRNSPRMAVLIPHVILMTMTGDIVWEAGVGFFKNAGSVLLLAILLSTLKPYRWLRNVVIVCAVLSVHYAYRHDIHHQAFLPPLSEQVVEQSKRPDKISPVEPGDYKAEIELVELQVEGASSYRGIYGAFHRQPRQVVVSLTNLSEEVWPASLPGPMALSLGVRVLRGKSVLQEMRIPLYKPIEPSEKIDLTFTVPIGGSWIVAATELECGLVQDSVRWLSDGQPEQTLHIAL